MRLLLIHSKCNQFNPLLWYRFYGNNTVLVTRPQRGNPNPAPRWTSSSPPRRSWSSTLISRWGLCILSSFNSNKISLQCVERSLLLKVQISLITHVIVHLLWWSHSKPQQQYYDINAFYFSFHWFLITFYQKKLLIIKTNLLSLKC